MWYTLSVRSSQTSNRLMRFIELLVVAGICRITEKHASGTWIIEVYVCPENEALFAEHAKHLIHP